MYKQGLEKIKFPEIEQNILKFWSERKIFEKSVQFRSPEKSFTFYEGPPTANGKPGIHHVMSRTLKDIVCRYKTMQGYRVERKAGWDAHGLPVEIEVEKSLGIKAIVEKKRLLFMYNSTRIHIDEVTSLGCFIEFESPIESSFESAQNTINILVGKFSIKELEYIKSSYLDLILKNVIA